MDDMGGAGGGLPPPPPPPPGSGGNRFAYLTGRLRSRQITMEEATELFAIQQAMIRSAVAAPSPSPAPSSAGTGPTPVASSSIVLSEDLVPFALIGMGVGAGLLAAMVKRFSEGPPSPSVPAPVRPAATEP